MTEGAADTSQQDFQVLKKKSLKGMSALFVRQVLVKVIFFAGNIILARLLAPQIFGIYAIVQFVVQFFSTFGDVGIGAALIQKKGELSQEELSTTFWLQQMLVWLVVGVVLLVAPLALKVYPTLPPVGVWLIRAMAVSFLFSSLKTIPAILMERNIDFKQIAWVDITENLAFQVVAVSCAYLGYGAWSFVAAAITRAFLGAVIIYALSLWRPSFHYRFESVKGLVRFGLPYQGNQLLNFLKDSVTPLFVGAYAGAAAVGYVNWAKNLAFAPLMVSETFGRVAFPAFSKLQDDKDLMARTVERSIRMMTLVMFPIAALMAALGPEITRLVFTDKWMPGIMAFNFYCFAPAAIGIALPLYSAILSLGKPRILLLMTIGVIVIEWGLGVQFVVRYGFSGIAFTQPIHLGIFTFVYWYVLKKEQVRIFVFRHVATQFTTAAAVALVFYQVKSYFATSLTGLIFCLLTGPIIYILTIRLIRYALYKEFLDYLKFALKR
jgi:PST family polysaccharide transporter